MTSPDDVSRADAAGPRARRRRPLVYLLGAALVAAAAAGAWVLGRGDGSALPGFAPADGRPVVPAAETPRKIAEIRIDGRGNTVRLRRTGTGWALAGKGGYPATEGRVESLLEGLGALRASYVSEQTPPPYAEYGLADIDAATGAGVRVTLGGDGGDVLDRFTLGSGFSMPGSERLSTVALTRPDDPRIWLAEGKVSVPAEPLAWVNRNIADIPRDRIAEVVAVAPDGTRVAIRRDPESGKLEVAEGMPEGSDMAGAWKLREAASLYEQLDFEAVRPAEGGAREAEGRWRVRARTSDGMVLRTTLLADQEEGAWARFEATASESGGAGAETARRLDARHAGWAYRLNPYAAQRFMIRPADLTAE